MAETGKTYNFPTADGKSTITMYNVTDSALNDIETLKKIVTLTAASGSTEVEYNNGKELVSRKAQADATVPRSGPGQNQSIPEGAYSTEETTARGMVDSFVEKVAPTLIATAVAGLPGAAMERILHAVSPMIADLANEKLYLKGTKNEIISTQEIYDRIAEKVRPRAEQPDTAPERVASAAGTAAAEGMGVLGAQGLLQKGAVALSPGNPLINPGRQAASELVERAGNVVADLPGKEILGSIGAGAGYTAISEKLKDSEMPEIAKELIAVGGSLVSGLSTAKLDDLGKLTKKMMVASGKNLTAATNDVIQLAKQWGVDALTSDWKPSTRKGRDRLIARELATGGTRDMRVPQNTQRIDAITRLKRMFGVADDAKLDDDVADIANDYWDKRETALSAADKARDEVIAPLSGADAPEVDVSPTMDFINSEIVRLSAEGDSLYKPVVDSVGAMKQAVESSDSNGLRSIAENLTKLGEPELDDIAKKVHGWAAAIDEGRNTNFINREIDQVLNMGANSNKPIINKLLETKAQIGNKDLSQIEEIRKKLGGSFVGTEYSTTIRDSGNKVMDELYNTLRNDMGETIKVNGGSGEFDKFEKAMSEMSTLAKDFDAKVGIPAILNSSKTDVGAWKNALFNENRDVVERIYKRLSPESQAKARAALITKMLDESTVGVNMSPNAFAAKIKDYGGSRGVLFSSEDSEILPGLKKVLDRTANAEGDRLANDLLSLSDTPGITRSMAAFIIKHPITGLSTILGAKAFRGDAIRWIESPDMRDLLLKYDALPEAKRFSNTGEEILKRMGDVLRAKLISEDANSEETETRRHGLK